MTPHPALPHARPADVGLCPDRTQRLMDCLIYTTDAADDPSRE